MNLVVIYRATDELSALSIRDLLDQNGITAMIKPKIVPGYGLVLAGLDGDFGIWGEVLIEADKVERAEELILGFRGTLGYLTEAGLDPDELERQALEAEADEVE